MALGVLPAPASGARVADLACGEGAWLEAVGRRWPGASLEGVDLDPAAIARAEVAVPGARLRVADGLVAEMEPLDLVVGNPPWGAGRGRKVRRGDESASEFLLRALELVKPGGRLCLLLPAAWLEVTAHREARDRLLAMAAVERIEPLGDPFQGVFAPAALLVARREPDPEARARQEVWTPSGAVTQATLAGEGALNPRLRPADRALLARLDARSERLRGRVTFILGVVTGRNRAALGEHGAGEPIVTGPDVSAFCIRAPKRLLRLPLERVQQAARRESYRRRKVVYRFIARHPVAAVDEEGRLTLNSANALAVDDPALDPHFVAAALNSLPLRFAHASRASLPRLLRSHLERLPLPAGTPAERRRIAELAEARGAAAQAELDELVMDLFALTDAERAWLRATCRAS
jgi:predicted RNA methylase